VAKNSLYNQRGNYDEAGERVDLLNFCDGLCSIVESTDILQRQMEWVAVGGIRFEIAPNLKHDLLTEERTFRHSREEINDPKALEKPFLKCLTQRMHEGTLGYAR
jgi:hypothetical protein